MKPTLGIAMLLLLASGAPGEALPPGPDQAPREEASLKPGDLWKLDQLGEEVARLDEEVQTLRQTLAELQTRLAELEAPAEPEPASPEVAREKPPALDRESWSDCTWRVVGKSESHAPQSEWCSPGSFITRVDLGSGPAHKGATYPILERVECCRIGIGQTR